MKLQDFGLLTDENVSPGVISWLRQAGFDVLDVCEQSLQGSTDLHLVRLAHASNRLIITHDVDFGTLAVLQGEPVIGLIYLRPGHFDPQFTIETVEGVLTQNPDVLPPFILVARRTGTAIAIRIRQL
jgi:predicted nuclease of predicted toxin-antitoxin system